LTQPLAISEVQITLVDGTVMTFNTDVMLPGAHYSNSRNFTTPPRKAERTAIKEVAETWVSHTIHFITDREHVIDWKKRNPSIE
jgi:hypothetical protein